MPQFGSSFSLQKPQPKAEAPAVEDAPVVEVQEPAAVEAPAKPVREIPSILRDPKWTLSFEGPMKRGPGSKR